MITAKTEVSNFEGNVISLLLFSSMANPAETYLSREIKDKVKNFKTSLSRTIDNKISFSKRAPRQTLDSEIEGAIMDIKEQKPESIAELLAEEETKDPGAGPAFYTTQPTSVERSSFAKLYTAFVSYTKAVYTSISSASKKVDGFVKLTLQKILKVHEYIMCLCSPHWNKVEGSPEDMDSRAHTISQKESVSQENTKYIIGQQFLQYRD